MIRKLVTIFGENHAVAVENDTPIYSYHLAMDNGNITNEMCTRVSMPRVQVQEPAII